MAGVHPLRDIHVAVDVADVVVVVVLVLRHLWARGGSDVYVAWSQQAAVGQGLALVHLSAQLKRILWDRSAFRGCLGGV